jgi:hypothetical protein
VLHPPEPEPRRDVSELVRHAHIVSEGSSPLVPSPTIDRPTT